MFRWLSYLIVFLMLLGIAVSILGIRGILAAERMVSKDYASPPLSVFIASVLSVRKYSWALLASAVVYGVFYAIVSSIIVYRPSENFAEEYLAVIPSVVEAVCCNGPGFTPVFTVYLTEHLGLLIIPANVLLMILVSGLVGVNVALAFYQYDQRPKGAGSRWFGGFGAITGLFTACPTCAGLFLGNLIQEVGTTAVAAALATYQPVFIAVTVPLLLGSTVIMTRRLRQSLYGSCSVVRILS